MSYQGTKSSTCQGFPQVMSILLLPFSAAAPKSSTKEQELQTSNFPHYPKYRLAVNSVASFGPVVNKDYVSRTPQCLTSSNNQWNTNVWGQLVDGKVIVKTAP